eukprot:NODE_1782_length_492_cov_62.453725_g1704_i0.p1 GENE.NODE_1782_length_492_cov_62.453725_g1704_i0~~NODE_1782_length_492_cov_62.453725_g1704_i0.p1  ORF type:complete len:78 (+),score=10.81 NODE_1782_length_492_cov_62.453725_g1704_i0:65-298(+)
MKISFVLLIVLFMACMIWTSEAQLSVGGQLLDPRCCHCRCSHNAKTFLAAKLSEMFPMLGNFLFSSSLTGKPGCGSY